MAKTRRAYSGNAASTTLTSGIGTEANPSITITSSTGWPSGAPFYVVIDPGTSAEEKLLVTRSSTTLTVSGSRGADDTSNSSHSAGAVIYPVFTAVDANEANLLASTLTTQGDLLTHGASDFARVAIGTAAQVLKVNSGATAPEWGQVATAGIADSAVTSAKIADGTIVAGDIADGAITSAKILDGTIATGDLADSAVTSAKIADSAVTSAKIADGTIVAGDIADGAVTSAKILNGTIVAGDIADGTITGAKIDVFTIVAGNLATGAVTSAKILDGTIATGDIADGAITSAKILDGTIVNDDISSSAAITQTKIAPSGISRTRTTTASIPNNSWTTVGFGVSNFIKGTGFSYDSGSSEITVPAGTIIIRASLRFDANATGTRGIRIIDASNVVLAQMNCAAAPTGSSVVNCSVFYDSGGANSLRVQAYQTSGGALDVEGETTTTFEAIMVAAQ